MKNIGFAITGCFCVQPDVVAEIKKLVEKGYNIIPILSPASATTNTRFGNAQDLIDNLTKITGNVPLTTIVGVEPTGPKNMIDMLVVAPCSGNTLAKIANGINDTSVTMVVKAHVRNNKPVVIAVSTNDAMGINFRNIATLMATKNIFFVPFAQDDFANKPKSLIADFELIEETMLKAYKGEQIQPVLLG